MLNEQGFDEWADQYDSAVEQSRKNQTYPFCGYDKVHERVFSLTENLNSVLDLGVGTGRLTKRLYDKGLKITAVDFSQNMLDAAVKKMPDARFIRADLTRGYPTNLNDKFDAIISLYAIHHLTDAQKLDIINNAATHLNANGLFIIGDVAFNTQADRLSAKAAAKDAWDDMEYYTVFSELAPKAHAKTAEFIKISFCAGVAVFKF